MSNYVSGSQSVRYQGVLQSLPAKCELYFEHGAVVLQLDQLFEDEWDEEVEDSDGDRGQVLVEKLLGLAERR